MFRIFLASAALTGMVACGDGNPFNSDGEGTVVVGDDTVTGTDLNSDMTANAVVYNDNGTPDPADDTLLINNLPFDNSDLTGGAYTRIADLPNSFELFESPAGSDRTYFAVFQRATHTQAMAAATNAYINPGFGGIIAQRVGSNDVPLPRPASYIFTGEYAGLRVYRGDGLGELGVVTGDAQLAVDILDFDQTGAVEGTVTNRLLLDTNGVFVANLPDFVSLATAEVDQDTGLIASSTAVLQSGSDGLGTGQWSGVFAGPGGAEIGGIVVIEGTTSEAEETLRGLPADTTVRENGAFIVFNGG